MSDPQVVETETVEAPQSDQEASAALIRGYNKSKGLPVDDAPAKPDTATKTTEVADDAKQATEDAQKATDEAAAKAAAEAAESAREKAYLESLPASVRARLEKLDKIDKIEATANQIGAAQRKLKTVEDRVEAISKAGTAAAKAATATGADAPTKAQIDAAAAAGGEKWKQMQEDFPDWAAAMDERLAALASGKAPVDVDALRKEVAGEVSTRIAESVDVAEERAFIRLKHPGWKTTVNTPDFKGWTLAGGPSMESYTHYKNLEDTDPARAQEAKAGFARDFPTWWQEKGKAIFSSSADDAVRLLDGFEAHRKAVAEAAAKREKNQTRLATVVAPKQANSGGPSVLPDEAGLSVGYERIAKRRA